jgi:hypothetical protein
MSPLFLMLANAHAGEIDLSWPEEPVRFHGELVIDSGEALWMLSRNNINARAKTVTMAADFTCKGSESRRGWELDCVVDQINLAAVPFTPREQEMIDSIMREYVELMTFEHVDLRFSEDGHLRTVNIQGIPKNDERAREVSETLRLFMRRLFSAFETQIPRRGDASVGQEWKHKGSSAAMEIFSKYGTVGGTRMTYEVREDADGVTVLSSSGYGTIGVSNVGVTAVTGGGTVDSSSSVGGASSSSEATNQSGLSSTGALYSVDAIGQTHFDSSLGWWRYADSIVQGQRNQSSPPITFLHAAWLGRINPDGSIVSPPPAEDQEVAPTETAPTEAVPAETAPTEAVPAETAPTETAPTEAVPAETAPTEVDPAEAEAEAEASEGP